MGRLAILFLVAGCGHEAPDAGDLSLSRDLAMASPDLAMASPDLASVADAAPAGPFCANTVVAGTCMQTFMAPVAQCFSSAGPCVISMPDDVTTNICWAGGKVLATYDKNNMTVHATWKNGTTVCMDGDIDPNGHSFVLRAGGQSLIYPETSGQAVCPGGGVQYVGENEGGCQALIDILEFSDKGCTTGSCS